MFFFVISEPIIHCIYEKLNKRGFLEEKELWSHDLIFFFPDPRQLSFHSKMCTRPNKIRTYVTRKANKLLTRTTVLDKLKQDLAGKTPERCLSIIDPTKSDSKVPPPPPCISYFQNVILNFSLCFFLLSWLTPNPHQEG